MPCITEVQNFHILAEGILEDWLLSGYGGNFRDTNPHKHTEFSADNHQTAFPVAGGSAEQGCPREIWCRESNHVCACIYHIFVSC